ncbi:MAG TPA: hypothetical protein VM074_04280 [Solimonas sp.]|nr:hypothetical protein [Solimonas sp.]
MSRRLAVVSVALVLGACGESRSARVVPAPEDPPQVAIGERLFRETRFAQFFAAQGLEVNAAIPAGDSVMDKLAGADGRSRPGPFAGGGMNCRQCHLVDDAFEPDGGARAYADFAVRSPIPGRADRDDPHTMAPRNSPALVNASLARGVPEMFHLDGEFASLEDLVTGTLTGRNYGWLPDEHARAVAHVARVVREDDGRGALAREFGGSYRRVLAGTDPALPVGLRLPPEFRLDVAGASDAAILAAVSRLVAAYVRSLEFSRDADGAFDGSPYDLFLLINRLPRQPAAGEAPLDYARRLRVALEARHDLRLVPAGTRAFRLHPGREFRFGEQELQGLRVFLAEPAAGREAGVGNCVACHAPPDFTDFGLHNTGATQEEFDALHGAGSFATLAIPGLAQRNADPAPYLPATAAHPAYQGRFRSVPAAADALATDLGAWVAFANPDMPSVQAALRVALCPAAAGPCPADEAVLERAVATFKTPGLRDLGHSAPYLHNGAKPTVAEVVRFYRRMSDAARAGSLRNGAAQLRDIRLGEADVAPLASFLDALDEDYD